MKPLHLTLRNFIGIRSGLNRDEITLDLRDKRGLIALVGPNGCGKTTILDNLTPFRLMAYRAGGYSPRQFSYYEETYGDAYKALTWEHGGTEYRSELHIKGSNKTKKTEAYLYVLTPDGAMPARAADGTASDGKTDTYDAALDGILGSPAMFYTSVFSSQSRRQLSEYGAGEIKGLLSELLGLDHLLALAEKADAAAKHQTAAFSGMQAQLQRVESLAADLAHVEAASADARARRDAAVEARTKARVAVMDAGNALAEARAKAANIDELKRRHARLNEAEKAAKEEATTSLNMIAAEIRRARQDGEARGLRADVTAIESRVSRLQNRRASLQQTIAAAPDPAAAKAEVESAQAVVVSADEVVSLSEQRAALVAEAASRVRVLDAELAAQKDTGASLRAEVTRVQAAAALAAEVPCHGLPINSQCKLLQSAHEAAEKLPDAQARITKARDQYAAKLAEKGTLEAEAAKLPEAQEALRKAKANAQAARVGLQTAQSRVMAATSADAATRELEEIASQLSAAADELKLKQAAIDEACASAAQREAAQREREIAVSDGLNRKLSAITAERADLPPVTADGVSLAAAEQAQAAAERSLTQAETDVAKLDGVMAANSGKAQMLREQMAGADALREQAVTLTDDIAQWRLLGKALGRDGIVALSIDDAGPTISSLANDLLLACYGNRFSLRFDTQAEKKDGSFKETFDIRVFDAERGDDKSVTKMSGGERIYINEALTRAIALYQAQAIGRSYQALFSDESDGALDAERKGHYVKMKRRVLEIGGYDVEFFISHTPDLWDLADEVIDVSALRSAA